MIVERTRGSNIGIVSPFGKDSFVQIHHDGILRLDRAVKYTFHVTVGSQWF